MEKDIIDEINMDLEILEAKIKGLIKGIRDQDNKYFLDLIKMVKTDFIPKVEINEDESNSDVYFMGYEQAIEDIKKELKGGIK